MERKIRPPTVTPRRTVRPPTITPRATVRPPTITPKATVRPPTVTPRRTVRPRDTAAGAADVLDQYNINLLPNEMQYLILDQLELEDLRKVYRSIADQDVRRYAGELAKQIYYYQKKGLNRLVLEGDLEGASMLLKSGEFRIVPSATLLFSVVALGKIDMVELLINHGAVMDSSATSVAITLGGPDYANTLLNLAELKGIKFSPDKDLMSVAIKSGDIDLVKRLIDLGGDVSGHYAAIAAIGKEDLDMLKWLRTQGTDVQHYQLKMYATKVGAREIRQWLEEIDPY